MINVSNAFKQELYEGNRNYLEYADITLVDGTELHLTNKDFWNGGMSIEDAVSGNDVFEVGAAIINSCSLTIENLDDRFSEYDFLNAKVVISIGLNLPDETTERVRKGTYMVNDPKYNGATISLNCQDNMAKFDRSYSESKLTYPATLGSIVQDACSTCDVSLQTYDFPHGDFVVQTRPTDEAITFREVISWAAQIAGCFCRCDVYGRLELKWYDQKLLEKHGYDGGIFDKLDASKYTTGDDVDGGSFNPWDTGDTADGGTFEEMEGIHHIYSHYSAPVISTDDVVITGVRVLEKAKEQDVETGSEKDAIITYQSGSDGYVVSIEDNELIQDGTGLEISNWLGEQLIGFRFRKASLSHASDPTIEAGDVAIVTDRKQNTYPIIISSTRFSTGSAQSTESSAETPARNSAARFSATTKNYVEYRKDIQRERTEREKAQEELKERIDSSSGLYTTEQTQPDGSTIFYMHDKPTLEESKIVWKMTAEAWGVSTDGGKSYNAGMTVDGDLITRILKTTGISFDWAHGGTLTLGGLKNGNGLLRILNDSGMEIGYIDNTGVHFESGEISGSRIMSVDNSTYAEYKQIVLDKGIFSFYPRKEVKGGEIYPASTIDIAYSGEGGIGGVISDRYGIQIDSDEHVSIGTKNLTILSVFKDFSNIKEFNNTSTYRCEIYGDAAVAGDMWVDGEFDSRYGISEVVMTQNYAERSLASPISTTTTVNDIGGGQIGEDGICVVSIDDMFSEVANTQTNYRVFLQKEGEGDIWVDSKEPAFFIVKGTPGIAFSWKIECVKIGYENTLMENYDTQAYSYEETTNYEKEYEQEIEELIKEREEYETA